MRSSTACGAEAATPAQRLVRPCARSLALSHPPTHTHTHTHTHIHTTTTPAPLPFHRRTGSRVGPVCTSHVRGGMLLEPEGPGLNFKLITGCKCPGSRQELGHLREG